MAMGMNNTKQTTEIAAEYERWSQSCGHSAATVRSRSQLAQSRMRAWGHPSGWTTRAIQEWLSRPELSRWSRSTYHANLKDFCAWASLAGHMPTVMDDVRAHRRPKSHPRPLSEAEVARVLAAATGNLRTWQMLALLAGFRAHEIAKIRGEDVTPEGLYVFGKGGSEATLPTHPDLWALAQLYPRSGFWFPTRSAMGHVRAETVTRQTSALYRSLGIAGSIHRARHVYGTRLLRAGVNIRQVQKLMRHANLETTAVYTAVDEDELRAAINLLSA